MFAFAEVWNPDSITLTHIGLIKHSINSLVKTGTLDRNSVCWPHVDTHLSPLIRIKTASMLRWTERTRKNTEDIWREEGELKPCMKTGRQKRDKESGGKKSDLARHTERKKIC